MADVREATFGGSPCLVIGAGAPVVVLPGLNARGGNPTGIDRWQQLRMLRFLTDHRSVHLLSRRTGLPPTTTMQGLADDAAKAIREELPTPVDVVGLSTGGAIALQLAVDHPELVRRLVLVVTACRLSRQGRAAQRRLADLTRAGKPRRAWAGMGPILAGSRGGGWLMTALLWLTGPLGTPDDPCNLLAELAAEDAFDASQDLNRVAAPTLVVAGGRDHCYGPDLARATAAGIPDARLLVLPRRGHMSVPGAHAAQREIVDFLERPWTTRM